MACRFIDGFDHYDTSQQLRKWNLATNTVIQSVIFRNGTSAVALATGGDLLQQVLDDQTSWVVGFAFRHDTAGVEHEILRIVDGITGSAQAGLRVLADDTLKMTRGSSGTVAGGTSTLTINANTWYYIEVKYTVSDSIAADTCIVRVTESGGDPVEFINVDAGEDMKNTVNATASNFLWLNLTAAIDFWLDDVYIFDGTGTENNDFAGDSKVVTLFPDGSGNQNDFDGSDGNSIDNHLLVDETPADDDTTHVDGEFGEEIDLYTLDDIAVKPASIHAVQVNMVAKSVISTRDTRALTRIGGVNYEGALKSPTTSYANIAEVHDVSPATGVSWQHSEINAAQFGIQVEVF